MKVTMIFYHEMFPRGRTTLIPCMNGACRRILFKTNATNMEISNARGLDVQQLEPSDKYIKLKCHSCGTEYYILFQ